MDMAEEFGLFMSFEPLSDKSVTDITYHYVDKGLAPVIQNAKRARYEVSLSWLSDYPSVTVTPIML